MHPLGTEGDQSSVRDARAGDERGDVDAVAARRERLELGDALLEQRARAVEVAAAPVMETDTDLQDAVIERAVGRPRRAPQELEGLVLLEEFAAIELFRGTDELGRRRVVAAGAERLVDGAARDALGRPRGPALAASRRGAPSRSRRGSAARPR